MNAWGGAHKKQQSRQSVFSGVGRVGNEGHQTLEHRCLRVSWFQADGGLLYFLFFLFFFSFDTLVPLVASLVMRNKALMAVWPALELFTHILGQVFANKDCQINYGLKPQMAKFLW